jgi:hypothetical protein
MRQSDASNEALTMIALHEVACGIEEEVGLPDYAQFHFTRYGKERQKLILRYQEIKNDIHRDLAKMHEQHS